MEDGATELDDASQNVIHALAYHELFSIDERDQRVGRLLDELDQVGVDRQGLVIETSQTNHVRLCPFSEDVRSRSLRAPYGEYRRDGGEGDGACEKGVITLGLLLEGGCWETALKREGKVPMDRKEIGFPTNERNKNSGECWGGGSREPKIRLRGANHVNQYSE